MARFGDNWETEFKPSWVLAQLQQQETIPYTREGGFNPKEYKVRRRPCLFGSIYILLSRNDVCTVMEQVV